MPQTSLFTPIDMDTWVRKEHFDYYYHLIKSKYTINANIDITHLQDIRKERGFKFFPSFLYTIMRSVNDNKEFRMSFHDGVLGYWEHVVPSYTIFHDDDKTFSDIWSEWHEDFAGFYHAISTDMETYKDVKGIKARTDRPENCCPISALPWLSFTGFNQDTFSESTLLFPLIRFGKYFEENGKLLIPLAVFVNHAVADGYHTSKLINEVQKWANDAHLWMR